MQFIARHRLHVLDAGPVDHFGNPGIVAGRQAHQAGLDGYVQAATGQVQRAPLAAGLAQHAHLGVRGDVKIADDGVTERRDDFAVGYQAGADRRLTGQHAAACGLQGRAHEYFALRGAGCRGISHQAPGRCSPTCRFR